MMRLVIPLLFAATAMGASVVWAANAPAPLDEGAVRQAVDRSLPLLRAASSQFLDDATCASCHNTIEPHLTAQVAKAKGLFIDEQLDARERRAIAEELTTRSEPWRTHGFVPGFNLSAAVNLNAALDSGVKPSAETDAGVLYLLGKQQKDGHWEVLGKVRAPTGLSVFPATADAIRAIDAYAPPALRQEAEASIARARAWVVSTSAEPNNEGLTGRLKALVWAKAPRADLAKAQANLIAAQLSDGGWAQEPGMASDAYATGQALLALHDAGTRPTDPAYRRGTDYLVRSQAADGSWHVKSRALPVQPPMDGAFPYGPDQWISAWGTALSTRALAYALPG